MKTVTYILPAYWASALVNDDYSGLEELDHQEIEKFLFAHKGDIGTCVGVSEDQYFSHTNDAHTLAGDVAEFTFIDPQG
jgi:hypothetical protein